MIKKLVYLKENFTQNEGIVTIENFVNVEYEKEKKKGKNKNKEVDLIKNNGNKFK